MIPKQIFFIWFGDTIPDYVNYCIDSFKNTNPSFSTNFIYYTINDIIKTQDSVVKYCKDCIFKTKNGIDNKYYQYISLRIKSKFNFIQILSDIIRFEILYYYGGIYLDCDTFPIKPFDDKLLNNNSFSQNVLVYRNKKYNPKHLSDDYNKFYDLDFCKNLKNYHCYSYTDIYFFGLRKEYDITDIKFTGGAEFTNGLNPPWVRNFDNTEIFQNLREKFYNKKLEIYKDFIFYSQYILHLCSKKWQKSFKKNLMYCEYDDYLYKE